MGAWPLTDLVWVLGILGGVAVIAGIGWLLARRGQDRRRHAEEEAAAKAASIRTAALKAASIKAAAAAAQNARAAAGQLEARRAAQEQAALAKAAREKEAVEQAIAEWAAAEQAEAERLQLRRAARERQEVEEMDFRLRAVEKAITEWVVAEQNSSRLLAVMAPHQRSPEKTYTRTDAVRQQVRLTAEAVGKEMRELEFIKNRIETGVDFLPIEFRQTVEHWKEGRALRQSSFDDLKLKFRYKAYSIEDGYELLRMYNHWAIQQQQKLRVFIRLLGAKVDSSESIQAALERAERNERKKELEMDVDVLFCLQEIREIRSQLIDMETIVKQLEVVCRKRSEQIISPTWEAKGSL